MKQGIESEVVYSARFHQVFDDPQISQAEIYEYYRSNIIASLKGYNYVLVTLGTKNSGKTYSLVGGASWFHEIHKCIKMNEL